MELNSSAEFDLGALFGDVADDAIPGRAIVADLGDHKCLIMKHHGLLTAGVNIGEAFNLSAGVALSEAVGAIQQAAGGSGR